MLSIKKIIKHKFFFNFVVILSIVHNIMFIADGSYNCVFIFSSLTLIFNYFLNKSEISLLCSIVFTNILFGCKKIKEGLKNKDDEEHDDEDDEEHDDEEHDDKEHDEEKHEDKKDKYKNIDKLLTGKKKNKMKEVKNIDKKKQKKNLEGLLNKFNVLKNDKDSIINPQALSVFMNLNKKMSSATSENDFTDLKKLLRNNKETMKNIIDAF